MARTRRENATTARKCVWLTEGARAAVQAWAQEHGTSFSAALETLARVGLGQPPQGAIAPALVSVLRREVQQQFHRVAALYAATAIEAGVASRLSGAALRTLRPEEYEKIKQTARLDAVPTLRRRNALRELAAPPDGNPRRGSPAGGSKCRRLSGGSSEDGLTQASSIPAASCQASSCARPARSVGLGAQS